MVTRYAYPRQTEPDMRKELNKMLTGVFPEIAKARPLVLRKMRKDEHGHNIKCSCISPNTKEADKDTFCPYCHGEGCFWDEVWIKGYRMHLEAQGSLTEKLIPAGLANIHQVTFYVYPEADINLELITMDDKIIEVALDAAGLPIEPHRRIEKFRIGQAIDLRSDNGKLEYWKLNTYTEKSKFLNGNEY